MDELERIVILRYGLDGDAPLTLKEVAARLGTTRQRVRELEERAERENPIAGDLRRCAGLPYLQRSSLLDDRPPICPRCGVTMVPAALSFNENHKGDWVCLECEELDEEL